MKKIIILLMAVSIMLTSCGKSAGLSNRNKGADNKTLSAAGAGKKQLPQGTNYKNSSKKTSADTIKEYLHTTYDFFSVHKVYIIGTLGSLIVSGLVFYYRKDLALWVLNDEIKALEQSKTKALEQFEVLEKGEVPNQFEAPEQAQTLEQAKEDIRYLTALYRKLIFDYNEFKHSYDVMSAQFKNAVNTISQLDLEKKKLNSQIKLKNP